MKIKLLLFLFLTVTCIMGNAQDELIISGSKKVNKSMTPQQIRDSLNKRFPDAEAVRYFKVPPEAAKNGWSIEAEDNLDASDEIEYYTINFKRNGMSYYGLYNQKGELLQSKEQENVDQLPVAVQNSLKQIGNEHPGYQVISKTYYKSQNHAKSKEYYQIVAEKGKEKKTLYYAPDGTLIKIKG